MTKQDHCCEECCNDPKHDHGHKENIINVKANEEFNGS